MLAFAVARLHITGVKPLSNTPDLWRDSLPRPRADDYKYSRGHTIVMGAPAYTGATRLAAEASSRIGSGLVTVLSVEQAQVYRATLPADIMVREEGLDEINRPNVILAGPGGYDSWAGELIKASNKSLGLVLDADAIRLCGELEHPTKVITPHAGEFERYFGRIGDNPAQKAIDVAKRLNVVVVLKGSRTLIAAPDGRMAENGHASPYLAKAGTGDVLAGMIAGLLAQAMPAFEAACAGVWLHGDASLRVGPGLVPQDLLIELRPALADLLR